MEHLAGRELKFPTVPRTGHHSSFERSIGKGPLFVWTRIVDRIEAATDIEYGDCLAIDAVGLALPLRDFRRTCKSHHAAFCASLGDCLLHNTGAPG